MTAPTLSQGVGRVYGCALAFEYCADAADGHAGGPIRGEGWVLRGAGEPVPDALVEASEGEQFARCRTDGEGAFHLTLRKPVVSDGAPSFEITVFAPGLFRHLHPRPYLPGDPPLTHPNRALPLLHAPRPP